MEVKSVDLDRKNSFAHLEFSDTYVKAWYKLKELEVALCSACLTTDQVFLGVGVACRYGAGVTLI